MCEQWEIARHCRTALSILLLNVQRQESSGSKRAHQSDNKPSTPSAGSKKRKTTPARFEEDQTVYNSLENINYQAQVSYDSTITQQTEVPQANGSSSAVNNTILQPLSESTTTQIHQETGADDTTISPSEVSILAMPNNINNEIIEELQWPDESSFLTTNFDLNMTDLFQNSSWDPMLFDVFNN